MNKKQNIAVTLCMAFCILTLACYGISAFRTAILFVSDIETLTLRSVLLLQLIPYAVAIVMAVAVTIIYYIKTKQK